MNDVKQSDTYITWQVEKMFIEAELEKLLSSCGNMMYEDRRSLCNAWGCPLYKNYCISIEPSEVPMIVVSKVREDET